MGGQRRKIGAELLYADFMLTANDRQKDYYVGAMIALGLIDPWPTTKTPRSTS